MRSRPPRLGSGINASSLPGSIFPDGLRISFPRADPVGHRGSAVSMKLARTAAPHVRLRRAARSGSSASALMLIQALSFLDADSAAGSANGVLAANDQAIPALCA